MSYEFQKDIKGLYKLGKFKANWHLRYSECFISDTKNPHLREYQGK